MQMIVVVVVVVGMTIVALGVEQPAVVTAAAVVLGLSTRRGLIF